VAKSREDLEQRLIVLRSLRRLLDDAFRVPGTRIRFGWDAIIGVIPWAGRSRDRPDGWRDYRPCPPYARAAHRAASMLLNIGIDLAIGLVPFAGDVADVFWKSNTRNMALLERHAAGPGAASAGDWIFVGAVIASVVAMALVPLLLFWLMLQALFGRGLF
jgi:hypothetical protein